MFDVMDVAFIAITLVSGLMFLAPLLIVGALIYFGFRKKKTVSLKKPEEMYTPHRSVFRYDPSYMKMGKTELTFRIIQYAMTAVLMIIMPLTMLFGFKTGTDFSNGLPIPLMIGFGATAVCGIVFAVTAHIANMMKRVRMAEYVGNRFFN